MLNCQVLTEKLPQIRPNISFEEDGNTIQRYFKRIGGDGNGNYIYYWKSKGLSDERSNYIKTSGYGITPY